MTLGGRKFAWRVWDPSEQPLQGDVMAIDTETHLIEESYIPPDLVVMQVCNGSTVDLVPYSSADTYLRYLDQFNPKAVYVFFNACFDYFVLKEHAVLKKAAAEDRLLDMRIRWMLQQLVVKGFYPEGGTSLENVTKEVLNESLDKDEDLRLAFRQNEIPTRKQLVYAAKDAAATYLLYERIPPQATETDQTRASLAFEDMTNRGFRVDVDRFNKLSEIFGKVMDQSEFKLTQFGYPAYSEPTAAKHYFNKFCRCVGADPVDSSPKLGRLKGVFSIAIAAMAGPKEKVMGSIRDGIAYMTGKDYNKNKSKVQESFESTCKAVGAEAFLEITSVRPLLMLLCILGEEIHKEDYDYGRALMKLSGEYENNGGWADNCKKSGKVDFMQSHLEEIERKTGLKLPRTESGKISLAQDQFWFYDANDLKDPLITEYIKFKHLEKMLSGFLDAKIIKPDGRTHAYVKILMKTGRVSMAKPNLQQLPKDHALREMFIASPGHVLITSDYSQVELCALAETCYVRYGESKMRDRINAGICLHSYLAAMTDGKIDDTNGYVEGDEESLKRVLAIIAPYKNDKELEKKRSIAKAGNFGKGLKFPTFSLYYM